MFISTRKDSPRNAFTDCTRSLHRRLDALLALQGLTVAFWAIAAWRVTP